MQQRRITMLVLTIALFAATTAVAAQDHAFDWSPRTGDAWVDTRLGDINHYGDRYLESFIGEMTRYYGAPRDLVSDLIVSRRWAPGDVYYACSIAQVIGRPCRHVVDEWGRNHGEGWGVVAQRLGIKPGSAQFHRLKRGFVPTYDRWSRPIELDRDLVADFPNRGKDHAGAQGPAKGRPTGSGSGKSKAQKLKPAGHGSQDKRKGSGKG